MIKKNILVISYGFDFENSTNATAHCLQALLPNLKDNVDVTVFTNGSSDEVIIKNDICLYKFGVATDIRIKEGLSFFSKKCLQEASILVNNKKIHSILTISFPFKVSEIGYLLKKQFPEIKLVSYFLDPYAYNSVLRFNKALFIVRYLKELKIINKSDSIIIANNLEYFYKKGLFSLNKSKIFPLPIPILNLKKKVNFTNLNKDIKLVFAGALDSDYRNPNGLLRTMLKVFQNNKNFGIEIYTSNKEVINNDIVKEFNGSLKILDFIDKKELEKVLLNADILVNIGNKGLKASLPSKLIEYIGYKKPILNYYFENDDLSMKFLEKYPNSISIKDSNINNDCFSNLVKFIQTANNYEITDVQITNNYREYLISNISNKIYSILTN